MSETKTPNHETKIYIGLAIVAVYCFMKYVPHIADGDPSHKATREVAEQENKQNISNENVIYTSTETNHSFCNISAVEKCVVHIRTHTVSGQGVIYAQRDDKLYIALPKHCLPDTTGDWIVNITTTETDQKISWESYTGWSNNRVDAAILILHGVRTFKKIATLSELGLIADRLVAGDTVYAITPFDPRGVKVKYGKLTNSEQGLVTYTPYQTETGDSGSPVVGRFGIIGLNSAINLGRGTGIFCPIIYFESLYIRATTPEKSDS